MWFVMLRHIKGRDYCQAMKKTTACPVSGTEQGSSSPVSSSLQSIMQIPAHTSIRGIKAERGI